MKEPHEPAGTPPMGWNSWDCFGASVTEAEVRENAAWMAERLLPSGWEYVVVDIQWYEPTADSSRYHPFAPLCMDGWSRLIPAENRFPSSSGGKGFGPLAEYVHGLGLKFGIHIMRGIPRQAVHADTPILGTNVRARSVAHPNSICPWNTDMYGVNPTAPGAQEYYDSLFALYAGWGTDFVKVDDIAASRLYGTHLDEIRMIRKAIDSSGRPMVLSLSPGPAPVELAGEFSANADMWRITDDFWDRWELLRDMFDRCERWYPYVGAGRRPDCDMLPLGHIGLRSVDGGGTDRTTRFTADEQRTMMTLWTIFGSPLMMGGHLPDTDGATLSLLTNPEVLEMHRTAFGARPVVRDGDRIVWSSRDGEGGTYVALFNVGEEETEVSAELHLLGLGSPCAVRNLWMRTELGVADGRFAALVPPHGAVLVKLVPSSRRYEASP